MSGWNAVQKSCPRPALSPTSLVDSPLKKRPIGPERGSWLG